VTSPLENLAGPGQAPRKEALRRSGLTRLADAVKEANALESRLDLAYNAVHSLCLAALRHAGFRPTNRYIVFQVRGCSSTMPLPRRTSAPASSGFEGWLRGLTNRLR